MKESNEIKKNETLKEEKIKDNELKIIIGGRYDDPPRDVFGCCTMRADIPARCDNLS